jgi:hypothetical protein
MPQELISFIFCCISKLKYLLEGLIVFEPKRGICEKYIFVFTYIYEFMLF